VLEWLSENRASIAGVIIIVLAIAFVISIIIGRRQTILRAKDEVFGDPERTKGGWYWAVCGICALLLAWFYYSWGVGRAYFPSAANEMCQIAKLEESISPITAALPIGSRYYKSTLLVARNTNQLDELSAELPADAFSEAEQAELRTIITQTESLIANSSDPANLNQESATKLEGLREQLAALTKELRAGPDGLTPSSEAIAQPKWGISDNEMPVLPMTPKGVLFDNVATKAAEITSAFVKVRNHIPVNDTLIADTKERIEVLKERPTCVTHTSKP